MGNKDIAERLGLSKPTVSRLMFTLMGLGYLRRIDKRGSIRSERRFFHSGTRCSPS